LFDIKTAILKKAYEINYTYTIDRPSDRPKQPWICPADQHPYGKNSCPESTAIGWPEST
jgi:hypothetical protein